LCVCSLRLLCDCSSTTALYTLSLHDALPISAASPGVSTRSEVIARRRRGQGARPVVSTWELSRAGRRARVAESCDETGGVHRGRSEEHTSELQSRENLVCRLLLEKKNRNIST